MVCTSWSATPSEYLTTHGRKAFPPLSQGPKASFKRTSRDVSGSEAAAEVTFWRPFSQEQILLQTPSKRLWPGGKYDPSGVRGHTAILHVSDHVWSWLLPTHLAARAAASLEVSAVQMCNKSVLTPLSGPAGCPSFCSRRRL